MHGNLKNNLYINNFYNIKKILYKDIPYNARKNAQSETKFGPQSPHFNIWGLVKIIYFR